MFKKIVVTALGLMVLLAAATGYWVYRPLVSGAKAIDIEIEPHRSVQDIAQVCADAGLAVHPQVLYWFFRVSGQSRGLRAGSYEVLPGQNALDLLRKLTRGEENLRAITLIEGWNFKQFRQALNASDALKHDTLDLTEAQIMAHFGAPDLAAEGQFFPDTYTFGKGSSDWRILERAHRAMQRQLTQAWAARQDDGVLKTPLQALILASIIEKETGKASDRDMIASVFHNRLKADMLLQTDPTVIYGLGDRFDGNLRRVDLHSDTPWNTYVHRGWA